MFALRPWVCSGIALCSASLLGGIFVSSTAYAAAAEFPKKEITVIVSLGPGGGKDILARGVARTMSKYLDVPVVVENVLGAGGALGLLKLYRATPDGHTIGVGMPGDIIDQIMEKRDYDSRRFTYIGRGQFSASLFCVRSDSPIRSVKDFKSYGKPIRVSTFSLLANVIVASMVLAERDRFPLVIVGGYKSAADANLALIRGEVEYSFPMAAVAAPFIKSGQIRPILTIAEKRHPDFPDVPTVGEAGHPDLAAFAIQLWFIAPPGVPEARAHVLEDALMKTLKDAEFVKWAQGAGVDIAPLSGPQTAKAAADFSELIEKYRDVIGKNLKR